MVSDEAVTSVEESCQSQCLTETVCTCQMLAIYTNFMVGKVTCCPLRLFILPKNAWLKPDQVVSGPSKMLLNEQFVAPKAYPAG